MQVSVDQRPRNGGWLLINMFPFKVVNIFWNLIDVKVVQYCHNVLNSTELYTFKWLTIVSCEFQFNKKRSKKFIRSVFVALSVQFSHSVMSDSLQPHESHHARPPCPSPTPRIHSDSCPSSRWCHPAILSSVIPFSSCPQSLPASESFPMSQLFAWGDQSTGASALASFLPEKSHTCSPLVST